MFSCFKCKLIFDSPQPPVATYITYIKYNWTWFYSCILFLRVPRETKSTSSTKVLETLPLTMPKQTYNPVTSMRWHPTSKIWSSSRWNRSSPRTSTWEHKHTQLLLLVPRNCYPRWIPMARQLWWLFWHKSKIRKRKC